MPGAAAVDHAGRTVLWQRRGKRAERADEQEFVLTADVVTHADLRFHPHHRRAVTESPRLHDMQPLAQFRAGYPHEQDRVFFWCRILLGDVLVRHGWELVFDLP